MTEDDESYRNDGGHPSWGQPPHCSPCHRTEPECGACAGPEQKCIHHDVCHVVHTYGKCGEHCDYDTPARGPVQQAPAITLPKDTTNLECIDEGLKGLSDYFNAALEGEESKRALRRMWDQQMGILFALLKNCAHDEQQIAALIAQAKQECKAWKLLESLPDKKGFVIFGAKEDPDGHFVSREKAIEFMQIKDAELKRVAAQAREDVLGELQNKIKIAINVAEDKIANEDPSLWDYSCRGPFREVSEWIDELRPKVKK